MVIDVKDGEHRLLTTFNKEWFDELRAQASADGCPTEFPGKDKEGFGWYEVKVPVKSTLTSLGFGLDASELFELNTYKGE